MGGAESRPVAQLGFSPWQPGDPVPAAAAAVAPAPAPKPQLEAPQVLVQSLGPTAQLVGSDPSRGLLYYFVGESQVLMEIDCVAKVMRKAARA
jgi:hypothetical protein